jgi:hypothetical protein
VKIRVLASHLPNPGRPVTAWAYYSEVYDDIDPSTALWTCKHAHESPQLAHGCAANWIEGAGQGQLSFKRQTA